MNVVVVGRCATNSANGKSSRGMCKCDTGKGNATVPRIAVTTCVMPRDERVVRDSAEDRSDMKRRGMISDGRGHDCDGRDEEGPTTGLVVSVKDRLLAGVGGGALPQEAETGESNRMLVVLVRRGWGDG